MRMSDPKKSILDIVMLVHDQAGWADLAIRAVEHHTTIPYRLIIVDMASEEPATRAMLHAAEARGHTVVTLPDNRSFSHGCNVGAGLGSSKFLCFLNDDALVTERWAEGLISDASVKDVGLVGARSNYASGAQMDPRFVGEPPYLVFVCVALRREVWIAVGPLDEATFDGFSSEDIDYAWRVKKAGYKLAVSQAYVLHAGSKTLAKEVGAHVQQATGQGVPNTELRRRNDAKYNQRLIDKWGKEHVRKYSQTVKNVLVGTFHPDRFVDVDFLDDFVNLKAQGGYTFTFQRLVRVPIHMARNILLDGVVDLGFDYGLMIDDDARFPPDTIRRLLSHGKDAVVALAYQRKPPHATCVFEVPEGQILASPLEGIEHTGLRRVDSSGLHVALISREAILKMREGTKDDKGNVIVPGTRAYCGTFADKLGEDLAFAMSLRAVGVPLYCDTDLITGHLGDPINVNEAYKRAFLATTQKR
jgi:GT2 family glycosyltransferase